MSDRSTLAEALELFENPASDETWEADRRMGQALSTIAAAARRVLGATPIRWCEAHASRDYRETTCEQVAIEAEIFGDNYEPGAPCRIVDKLVIGASNGE